MQHIERKDENMILRTRTVAVKRLPAKCNSKAERLFLRALQDCLTVPRPCIVLDCSEADWMDKAALHLTLRCLEEAMKRNGDVRLVVVGLEAKASLKLAGIDRLFRIFEEIDEAVESFHRPAGFTAHAGTHHSLPEEHAA
jgi:anti-anti-sigma factor